MLTAIDTKAPKKLDKKEVKKQNKELLKEIINLQKKMQAGEKHSLLIILQGMDAAGKSGAAKVLAGVNPAGVRVKSFKKPTDLEFAHDFLWRVHKHVPKKGMIQIFDRSHYEDILVPSVKGYIRNEVIEERYDLINSFERIIEHNGTKILKFYLHVSKEIQELRLMERIQNPQKHWKHNDGDWETRENWDKYMKFYETIFESCNHIPWQIIPSDNNWYKENLIAKAIINEMKMMQMEWPQLESELFKQ